MSRPRRKEFAELIDGWAARTSCAWPVAEHYEIVTGWIVPSEDTDGDNKIFRFPGSPLIAPDLVLSFARLGARGEPSKNSVLGWVEKYGVLLDEHEDGRLPSMRLQRFKDEVHCAHWLLSLYTDIRSRSVKAIKARVSNPRSALDEQLREAFEEPREEGGRGITLNSEEHEVLWLSFLFLIQRVEEQLARVQLSVSVEAPEEFDPKSPWFKQGWHCPDLLSAIYLQFYLLLTNSTPMRPCENPACGMPFPATPKNKQYCNATCRSNARYHRERGRQRKE